MNKLIPLKNYREDRESSFINGNRNQKEKNISNETLNYEERLPFHQVENKMGMRFIFIRPGRFLMGSPRWEKYSRPDETLHKVTLTRYFYIQDKPVTVSEWSEFIDSTDYKTEAETDGGAYIEGTYLEDIFYLEGTFWENPGYSTSGYHPVTCVSWNDVQQFIKWMNRKGIRYRLPSEAEWEYVCRAGTDMPYSCGKYLDSNHANFDGNLPYIRNIEGDYRAGLFRGKVIPAGVLLPNPWGVYDMHGNVWEWCQDSYGDYPYGSVIDPRVCWGNESICRVIRGGSWIDYAGPCRSAQRMWAGQSERTNSLGFRLVMMV